MNVEFPQFLKILQTSLEYHPLHVSPNSRPPVASPVLHCCKMHQGELARSPSLAQAEMIQRLNPVAATTRPRPPKLTPASASASLHDDGGIAEVEKEDSQRRGKEDSCRSKTSKVIPDHSQQKGGDEDTLRKSCEETAATVADPDKSSSLDLPCLPPTIMVTPISEVESDSEATTGTPGSSSSAAAAAAAAAAIAVQAGPQMHYLSPFTHIVDHRRSSASSTCSAVSTGGGGCGGGGSGGHGSRTTSESNLSSSGYGLFEEFYIVRRVLNQLVPVKVQKSDLDYYSTFPDILP